MRGFDDLLHAFPKLQRRVARLEAALARTSGPATVTVLPADDHDNADGLGSYPQGISVMRVTGTAIGWPETHGLVETIRLADDSNRQTFTSMSGAGAPAFRVRRWVIGTSSWTAWATL